MTDEDAFGHYIAGFVDGEGCFTITKGKQGRYCPEFLIHLAAGDIEILEYIQHRLGGHIRTTPAKRAGVSATVKLRVCKKSECLEIVSFFNKYPLRAKKRLDFELWSNAVRAHSAGAGWEEIAKIKEQLSAARKGTV